MDTGNENIHAFNTETGQVESFQDWDTFQGTTEDEDCAEYVQCLHLIPNMSCDHCYGRGRTGKNVKTNQYIPCRCLKPVFENQHYSL